jgi:predicted PurR-regulated permease PerM
MTTSPPYTPSAGSLGSRLLFLALGLVALGIATIITLGVAIAGVVSIGIAWFVQFVQSRRGKRLTRGGAWLASAAGTVAVLLAVFALVLLFDDTATRPLTAEQRAESRARSEEAMPEWLRNMSQGGARRTAATDSVTDKLAQNKYVVAWMGMMGAVVASSMIGAIAGSFAWGGVMLLYRGYRGHWLGVGPDISPVI